jgi:hypothetical protein
VVGSVPLPDAAFVAGPIARLFPRQGAQSQGRQQPLLHGVDDAARPRTRDQREGQAAHGKDLVGPEGGVHRPCAMAVVHHIMEEPLRLVPEPKLERLEPPRERRRPPLPDLTPDLERVQPESLNLHRLADAGRDRPFRDLGIHPGEGEAGLAGGEQAVGLQADAVACPLGVALEHGPDRLPEGLPEAALSRRLEVFVGGDHVPERGIDGVVLRLLFRAVGEAVGEHPLRHRARPLLQDAARRVHAAGGQAEAAESDEGVAAPIQEPGVAGHNRLPTAARHQVGIARAVETGRKRLPARTLGHADRLELRLRPLNRRQRSAQALRGQDQDGFAPPEVPAEDTGRGQVLREIEPPGLLLRIEEVPVPVGLGRVGPVRQGQDPGQAGVGTPGHPALHRLRGKAELRVLVVEGVMVPPGEEGPHPEDRGRIRRQEPPG